MKLFSPIHHTFAPHVDSAYVLRSMSLAYQPWKYKSGIYTKALTQALEQAFGGHAYLFATGREALLALLKSLPLRTGEEIIIQGYTCVVLPNAIHAASGVPVYADIQKETLNIDPDDVGKKITHRTRAVICQHTFGIPADTKRLREICDAHHLLLIEDCAHVIPDTSESTIGKHGDIVLASFGRDKALSGITGGAVIVRNEAITSALRQQWNSTDNLPLLAIDRLFYYPPTYFFLRPLYGLFIGKLLLTLLSQARLFPRILSAKEKQGGMSPVLHRMPNVCAALVMHQWKKRRRINDHRRTLTKWYKDACMRLDCAMLPSIDETLPLQKFPILLGNAKAVRQALKKHNIHLDDGWTDCVVCPSSVKLEHANYADGDTPVAEKVCREIVSLPTHPTMTVKKAQRLMQALTPFLH